MAKEIPEEGGGRMNTCQNGWHDCTERAICAEHKGPCPECGETAESAGQQERCALCGEPKSEHTVGGATRGQCSYRSPNLKPYVPATTEPAAAPFDLHRELLYAVDSPTVRARIEAAFAEQQRTIAEQQRTIGRLMEMGRAQVSAANATISEQQRLIRQMTGELRIAYMAIDEMDGRP